MSAAAQLLRHWIARQAAPDALAWFEAQRATIVRNDAPAHALGAAIAAAPRRLGKADLALTDRDLGEARAARSGWKPQVLGLDQAARIALLLDAAPATDDFAATLQRLVAIAAPGELIAIYRGLPLYPDPARLVPLAIDGLRTSIRYVFEAVAHASPFPAAHFPEPAWNQMVLKALFIDSRLDAIDGLDARANPGLARTLCDYAHERWAAGRSIHPELWRSVGRFADTHALADLERVLRTGAPAEQRAAALALADCPHPDAATLLAARPDLQAAIVAGTIRWSSFEV